MVTWEPMNWEVEVEENIMLKNKDTKDDRICQAKKGKEEKGGCFRKKGRHT